MSNIETESLTPSLLWSQTKEFIFIDVQLNNLINENIILTKDNLYFSGISNNNKYEISFDLYNNIDNKNSFIIDNNNNKELIKEVPKKIKIVLKKEEENEWTFLQKNKYLYKNNIKTNWNKWVDEDSDNEENMGDMDMQSMMGRMDMQSMMGGMDMQSMMQNMGGMDMENMMGEEMDSEEIGEEDYASINYVDENIDVNDIDELNGTDYLEDIENNCECCEKNK
jgi:hypothetical protein